MTEEQNWRPEPVNWLAGCLMLIMIGLPASFALYAMVKMTIHQNKYPEKYKKPERHKRVEK